VQVVPAQRVALVDPVLLAALVALAQLVQPAAQAVRAPWRRTPAAQAPQAVPQRAARAAMAAA
jgi:hypothetical protein